jgi:hypothetical protein
VSETPNRGAPGYRGHIDRIQSTYRLHPPASIYRHVFLLDVSHQEFIMKKVLCAAFVTAAFLVPLCAQAGEVLHREDHQENRIYQGVRSDSLNRSEYDHLQTREDAINVSRARDLRRNDGHLTAREYRNLNERENALSNRIWVDKHN